MDDTTGKMVKYDLNFILSPLLPEEKVAEECTNIREIIETHGGNVFESEMPKLRPLAYPVVKRWVGKKSTFDQGQYGWLKFEVSSSEMPAIKSELALFEHILRATFTHAYLDVRPVRKIPAGVEEQESNDTTPTPAITASNVEVVQMHSVEAKKEVNKESDATVATSAKQTLSEAEIDKQIESLLS